jgi:hypothetical protein
MGVRIRKAIQYFFTGGIAPYEFAVAVAVAVAAVVGCGFSGADGCACA